jgi:hypothetical protein
MKSISEFFKRIGGVQTKEVAKRDIIRLAIKEFTNIDIPISSISVKSNVVNLKGVSQSARSVIFIHKKKIIDFIFKLEPTTYISDIR